MLGHSAEQLRDFDGLEVQIDSLNLYLTRLQGASPIEVDVPAIGEVQFAHVITPLWTKTRGRRFSISRARPIGAERRWVLGGARTEPRS